ncbi:2-oxoglutarate dehydrogenase E1 component [Calycomorphotria hydatis]|uniref:oxoglutarate dehydrogenase (succinyl-transferring) n=1 Tax=Calycomorphotria hydatis TaxID=2528027 RepID=A0A517T4V0_9PLAN|nr:2-oxoglutarate dehydrogenase E1 component [Calycomorphotria hydatis]QDT63388.1 2-oxoglutarate dehydrogenase E1 component [Calycomorphotria hydatis]
MSSPNFVKTISDETPASPSVPMSNGEPVKVPMQTINPAPAVTGNGRSAPKEGPGGLNTGSLPFMEEMYQRYQDDPQSVSPDWRDYFEQMAAQGGGFTTPGGMPAPAPTAAIEFDNRVLEELKRELHEAVAIQERVDQLIRNYRVRGHIAARIDPLGRVSDMPAEMDPAFYGFTEADMDRRVNTTWVGGPERRTLRQIISWLHTTYCRSIGVQFMHIDSLRVRSWLQERMEGTGNYLKLSKDEQFRIYRRLSDAVIFEEFIQKKYITKKRFSLEGAESLIPLLDMAIEKAGRQGVNEIVLGMAHRGRLNVLANIMGKSPSDIFREFEDNDPEADMYGGDVKYHLGYSSDWRTADGNDVHISLCFNPSHLEFINPIVMGRVRAKMDRADDYNRRSGMVLLIHGDAAFAGEGIVQESLNLSELDGYSVGGTIHVVLNNQIGFTTTEEQGRSTAYATDVAKMLQSPIFHVNGEDPEAVAQVINLALDFREKFQKDVVIDMYCYRRHGHNEADEPSFTQPLMYQMIGKRPTTAHSYLQGLLERGDMTEADAKAILKESRKRLEAELKEARADVRVNKPNAGSGIWRPFKGGHSADEPDTAISEDVVKELLRKQYEMPEGFTPHPKIEKQLLTVRKGMAEGTQKINWGTAEALAFASIVTGAGNNVEQPYTIRFSGQDVERGTFSHRHAVLHDYASGERYIPLANLSDDQASFQIINSPLSEMGVLGFEYGYSLDTPDGLVLWEAQFGDFVNCAQVVIDQFITSAEDKWRRLSGLVMLLPHGFEGQGPEHSSARLERFLMAAAEDNIQICYPSTPDQYFHMLRRQVLRKWRKPLIVMTPKSLLRLPEAVSPISAFTTGEFMRVIPNMPEEEDTEVRRVLLCSGKVYYDLDQFRRKYERFDTAILRLEQLYPFPEEELRDALAGYSPGTEVVWVQEEPENMGAWRFLYCRIGDMLFEQYPFRGVTRPESASPATGSNSSHHFEQDKLVAEAFAEGAWKDHCPVPPPVEAGA